MGRFLSGRALGGALAGVVLTLFAAGCSTLGDPEAADDGSAESQNTDDSPTSSDGQTEPGYSGQVIARSDVATIEDQPIQGGALLVIPAAETDSFWAAAGLANDLEVISKVGAQLDAVPTPSTQVAVIGPEGRFEFDPWPGELLVCLANIDSGEAGPPFQTLGCAEVPAEVWTIEPVQFDVGIGGFTLSQ